LLAEDINPMEGAINIVDAMLVFSCGLLLSLVIYWNVDLRTGNMIPVKQGEQPLNPEQIQDEISGDSLNGYGYEEVGKVYRDPATGKLYLAEEGGSDGAEPNSEDTGA
jgi:hypothetical protein